MGASFAERTTKEVVDGRREILRLDVTPTIDSIGNPSARLRFDFGHGVSRPSPNLPPCGCIYPCADVAPRTHASELPTDRSSEGALLQYRRVMALDKPALMIPITIGRRAAAPLLDRTDEVRPTRGVELVRARAVS